MLVSLRPNLLCYQKYLNWKSLGSCFVFVLFRVIPQFEGNDGLTGCLNDRSLVASSAAGGKWPNEGGLVTELQVESNIRLSFLRKKRDGCQDEMAPLNPPLLLPVPFLRLLLAPLPSACTRKLLMNVACFFSTGHIGCRVQHGSVPYQAVLQIVTESV